MPAKRTPRSPRLRTDWRAVLASAGSLLLTLLLLRRWRDETPEPPDRGRHGGLYDLAALTDWSEPELDEVQPERRDVRVGSVLLAGLALTLLACVGIATVTGFEYLATGRPPSFLPPRGGPDDPAVAPSPSGVVEEGVPGQALQSVRATEAVLLNGYGWVDQSAGVVRLPIDRAMQLLVQRGLPLQPGAEARDFNTYDNSLPLDSSSGRKYEAASP